MRKTARSLAPLPSPLSFLCFLVLLSRASSFYLCLFSLSIILLSFFLVRLVFSLIQHLLFYRILRVELCNSCFFEFWCLFLFYFCFLLYYFLLNSQIWRNPEQGKWERLQGRLLLFPLLSRFCVSSFFFLVIPLSLFNFSSCSSVFFFFFSHAFGFLPHSHLLFHTTLRVQLVQCMFLWSWCLFLFDFCFSIVSNYTDRFCACP